jgi:hypothetical protein
MNMWDSNLQEKHNRMIANSAIILIITKEQDDYQQLSDIIKETFVEAWLDSPNSAFDNKKPRELIIEQNISKINTMISKMTRGERKDKTYEF